VAIAARFAAPARPRSLFARGRRSGRQTAPRSQTDGRPAGCGRLPLPPQSIAAMITAVWRSNAPRPCLHVLQSQTHPPTDRYVDM